MKALKIESRQKTVVLLFIMVALFIGSAVLVPVVRETEERVSVWYYVFSAILALGGAAYAYCFERRISEGLLFWLLPLSYVISFLLLLLVENPLVLPFWCFGGMLLLCAFRLRYAVLMNGFLLFVIGCTQSMFAKEAMVMQLVCLLLLSWAMPIVRKWMDAVNVILSVLALLISVRMLFFFTAKQDIFDDDIFQIALVYVVIIFATTLFSRMLWENAVSKEPTEAFDFLEELAVTAQMQDAELQKELEAENDSVEEKFATVFETNALEKTSEAKALSELCAEDAALLAELSELSPAAFLHARRVALIASEIAERLENVNALLVKAGGYYHEIGRLLGKNTLENTMLVAKQERFPEPLMQVLREHTVNGDKPTSREAALVFLTDNICGTCEYLKKAQDGRVLTEKVIDKALNLRMAKGDLNASGLSIKEFSVIRNAMTELIKEDMF